MSDDSQGADSHSDLRLTDLDIEWLKAERAQAQARGAIAKNVRDILTFIIVLLGAYALLWDGFKSMVGFAK